MRKRREDAEAILHELDNSRLSHNITARQRREGKDKCHLLSGVGGSGIHCRVPLCNQQLPENGRGKLGLYRLGNVVCGKNGLVSRPVSHAGPGKESTMGVKTQEPYTEATCHQA